MSVFHEFLKMWMQKFPDTLLSSALESDVRDSLTRHRERILELQKELDQESLYCMYLEKLLSDVSKIKEDGGNPETLVHLDNPKLQTQQEFNEETEKQTRVLESYSDEINLRRCVSELHEKTKADEALSSIESDIKATLTPNHFVTVIEVNENENALDLSAIAGDKTSDDTSLIKMEEKKYELRHYENVVIETKREIFSQSNEEHHKVATSTFTGGSVLATAALFNSSTNDFKKRIPPRPPPKFSSKRIPLVPVLPSSETSPTSSAEIKSSSLDRNVRPSEMLRQKSSNSLDIPPIAATRTFPKDGQNLSKSAELTNEVEEFIKSDFRTSIQSSPIYTSNKINDEGSVSYSLSQGVTGLPDTGSKESIGSSGVISDRMKSYESVSSLNSDGLKNSGNQDDHYYDSVPIDNVEGDYVYIKQSSNNSPSPEITTMQHAQTTTANNTDDSIEPESPGKNSNYVNIDYFIQKEKQYKRSISIESDVGANYQPTADETNVTVKPSIAKSVSECRNVTIRQIISSIIDSETSYVECLNKMRQYMKAFKASLSQAHPVVSQEDYETIFFKIDELYTVHEEFLLELRIKLSEDVDICVGDVFLKLTAKIDLYSAFLHNYGRAIETVKKCGSNNCQFRDIVAKIVVNSPNEQSLTLEDLLHKPVARVQKNALNIQDLLNHTPETHTDNILLKQAQKKIRSFLTEFNVPTLKVGDDKALRRLVKNTFIVELADGHRKLRHLFLFNDVIVCAKYKASGRDQFEFELKWYIPLQDILVCEEPASDPKEASPLNIIQLKSQACTMRDQLMLEGKEERKRLGDKHRKKLADLEAQLVLASPNLVFKISNRINGKIMTFFLSSDFERSQWIDSILTLQQSCNLPGVQIINVLEVQAWIAACKSLIKTEMGSYLLRSGRDESLLVGDLHLTIQHITGLDQAADHFICVEVDSYGHYFRKAKTKIVCQSMHPIWNESFIIELEGSQNIRILLYQDDPVRPLLKAKYIVMLSRQWLKNAVTHKLLKLTEQLTLNVTLRFIPGEVTLRRVPTAKPGSLFGNKLQNVLKREKRDIPFIISACIREVDRRGISEVGIYRVSGSASDLVKLKKSFESNPYEAEQLLKEVDIHSVTGILKAYLRDLPEALFTDALYQNLFETFNKYSNAPESQRVEMLFQFFDELPPANQATINIIINHLIKVNKMEAENKMSLHNLAMVLGPTLLRPGKISTNSAKHQKDFLESSTVDVMAQAGILYCFLLARMRTSH